MHPTQTKNQARTLFFQSDLTRTQIAEMTGVSPRTLFDWIKEGDWLRARANAASAPALIAEGYYAQLTELNKKIARRHSSPFPTLEESTIIRRLAGTVKTLKPTRNRNEAVELMTEFSRFVRNHSAAAANVLTDVITAFLETVNKPLPAAEDEQAAAREYAEYLASAEQEEKDRKAADERLRRHLATEERAQQKAEQASQQYHQYEEPAAEEEQSHVETDTPPFCTNVDEETQPTEEPLPLLWDTSDDPPTEKQLKTHRAMNDTMRQAQDILATLRQRKTNNDAWKEMMKESYNSTA